MGVERSGASVLVREVTPRKSTALVPVPKIPLAERPVAYRVEAALATLWGELESAESQRGYKSDWGRYCSWCALEGLDPAAADVSDVQRYVNVMRDRKMAKATRARALSVIREVYRALVVAKVCLVNPAREVKNPKVQTDPRTPWMSEEQTQKFFEATDDTWLGRRDHLISSCMFLLGWRRSEIARIEIEHIGSHAIWHVVKRGKEETVGLPLSLEAEIEEWKAFAGIASGFLFPRSPKNAKPISSKIVYDVVKTRAKAVGFDKIAPHSLRRSFATALIGRGEELRNIQLALSHSSGTVTERYVKAAKAAGQAPGEKLADLVYGKKEK